MLSAPDLTAPRLSKSKLVAALQCERRLWLAVNHPEAGIVSPNARSRFASGNDVGTLARDHATRRCGATEMIGVAGPNGWPDGLLACRERLASMQPVVLFEAPFAWEGVVVVADIVMRDVDGRLSMIEVKSSTSHEQRPYIDDAAFQAWVMGRCGFAPDRTMLRLIDSRFVYRGNGDYDGLFKDVDVTEAVAERLPHVPRFLAACRQVVAGPEPERRTGRQCGRPYECEFREHCRDWEAERFGPASKYPVSLLSKSYVATLTKDERNRLKHGGWEDVREVPASFSADARTRAVLRSFRDGTAWRSRGLAPALRALPYPRWHFDFETISRAIPRWAGTRPYQQVPFQWSCHVERRDGSIEHHEFLDLSGDDPRRECARRIARLFAEQEPQAVLAYNAGFERQRLEELAQAFPEHRRALRRVAERLCDLLPIMRAHYHHPEMHGSWSLKAVLPTVVPEMTYSELNDVQHGGDAQDAWREATDLATRDDRRQALRLALLAYCKRDTEATLALSRTLARQASAAG